ncbi:MAG: PASTA domain-containing protein [Clostridiales bacterium]|nr:PASTA domain-containing protein [Clostridiales bacterium]
MDQNPKKKNKKPRRRPRILQRFLDRPRGTTTTSVFSRTVFVMTLLGFVTFAILIAKLFQVQLVDYEVYQRNAVSQQTRNDIITPSRGTIYDCNGKQLAVSASVETVILNPSGIKDDEQSALICEGLSRLLGVDYDTLVAKAAKNTQYEYVAKKIDREKADEVRAFIEENKLSGAVYLVEDTKRYYPYGNFLSHVLGFCGTDNNGLYGIEYYFDDELTGEPGRIISAKNGRGVDMLSDYEQYYYAQDGDSIELTIDEVIQHYLEKHLEECYRSTDALVGVTGIVMDVNSASILGMACKPDFDLNNPYVINDEDLLTAMSVMDEETAASEKTSYLQNLWSNRAVNSTYEPGSVFKIITGAMALEENLVSEGETFYCGGAKSIELSGEKIGCWSTYGHGDQTFTEGVMHSCNCMFIELGMRIGPATFFKYFKAFGLTQKSGLTLPGESGGSPSLYHDEKGLQVDVQLANSAFGQSFKVSPVQIITAVSAVANGGTLYQPRIVSRIIAADGTIKQDSTPVVVRQVLTESTSKRMNEALEQVVSGEGGTGRNAYVKGYRVAGKTGTSQKLDKLDENGEATLRIVSFLAYAPADDPQVAVLIIVDEPQNGTISGGALAAPVAADVIADVLPYLGVEPIYTEEELKTLDIYTPDFDGMTREEVEERAKTDGLTVTFKGDGDTVTGQMPAAGSVVPRNVEMIIYMGADQPSYDVAVPNLVGMTYRGIQKLLKSNTYGYYFLRPVGLNNLDASVCCVKQSPEPGEIVKPGTVITLDFIDDSITE